MTNPATVFSTEVLSNTVLGPDYLPLPELHAAKLDGEVRALGEGFLPVDAPETCTSRALAIMVALSSYRGLGARLVAEQRTAAWVWGASSTPPSPHQFSCAETIRSRPNSANLGRIREVVVEKADLSVISGLRLTTPLRTVFDLVRHSPAFGAREKALVRQLLDSTGLTLSDCLVELDGRHKFPLKSLGLQRLVQLPERLF